MTQNVPDFGALLRSAERSACHLEMRDSYMDDPVFADWRAGLPVGRQDSTGGTGLGRQHGQKHASPAARQDLLSQ
ncbi:DUF6879 family protein [Kitasatospora azatica]|uniref:DUF6879 family protein n=1 Tax=Kitasatospora azatica TaxID=58347 RepID=UPI0012FAD5C0|nr:DUF6879 family protein [Kitasatospora azatica]